VAPTETPIMAVTVVLEVAQTALLEPQGPALALEMVVMAARQLVAALAVQAELESMAMMALHTPAGRGPMLAPEPAEMMVETAEPLAVGMVAMARLGLPAQAAGAVKGDMAAVVVRRVSTAAQVLAVVVAEDLVKKPALIAC